MIPAMALHVPNLVVQDRDGGFPPAAPTLNGPFTPSVEPSPPMNLDQARRRLRVRLLHDLVSRGLYRIPMEALAERLADVLHDES
jgi:hypothetical protein